MADEVAVASMTSTPRTSSPLTPLSSTQFPDHANWADATSSNGDHSDVKAEEKDECGEGPGTSNDSSSGHNSQETDSDIASSRPPSPLGDSSKSKSKEKGVAVKQEPQPEETIELPAQDGAEAKPTSAEASERSSSSWAAETQLPKLSDEELNNAKVLVLDLLGWGVPPEYIIQRGVSYQLLYTVFTDLRLRLPDNIVAECVALAKRLSIK